jgi:prophage antirepressor-like protein
MQDVMVFRSDGSSYALPRIIVDSDPWFRAKNIATVLGYANTRHAILVHVDNDDKRKYIDLVQGRDDRNEYIYLVRGRDGGVKANPSEKHSIYINQRGMRSLVLKSQRPEAIDIAKQLGIEVNTKYLRKEIEVVSFIQQFLTSLGEPFEFQKTVGSYRVDLYLSSRKIAVEIDEHGHRGRDSQYEREREAFITAKLQCQFLRIDPDDPTFSMAKCIADVARLMFYK